MTEKTNTNNMNEVVEFSCKYGTASFSGYAYVEDLDDFDYIHYYDRNNQPQGSLSNAYFEGTPEDIEALQIAFSNDILFGQFLADFADEEKTIDRGDYILKINC